MSKRKKNIENNPANDQNPLNCLAPMGSIQDTSTTNEASGSARIGFGFWNPVTRWVGSYPFALVILTLLTIAMAWATRVDALFGSEVSAFGFYRSGWFIGLIALLGASVLSAMFNPKRWTVSHLGFLTVHAGLVILLAGCAISLIGGWEADLQVFEGCRNNIANRSDLNIEVQLFDSDPSKQMAKNVNLFEQMKPLETISARKVWTQAFRPGPISWSEYDKLGWFPWRVLPVSRGLILDVPQTAAGDPELKVEVLDFRKPYREINSGDQLTISVKPASKELSAEEAKREQTDSSWTQISLQSARSINQGLIGRSRLNGGQVLVYRKLESPSAQKAFLEMIPDQKKKGKSEDQFVFWYKDKVYRFTKADFLPEEFLTGKRAWAEIPSIPEDQRKRVVLGDDYQLTLLSYEPVMQAAVFELYEKKDKSKDEFIAVNSLTLLSLLSEFNRIDDQRGLYGEFFSTDSDVSSGGASDSASGNSNTVNSKTAEVPDGQMETMRRKLTGPRLEIAQGADQNLYYRQSIDGTVTTGMLSRTRPYLAFAGGTSAALFLVQQEAPGIRIQSVPLEEQQPSATDPAAVLVRLTLNGQEFERWITVGTRNPLNPPTYCVPQNYLLASARNGQGKETFALVTIPRQTVELSFCVLLERFNRRLDPGTSMPSHYSSDVSVFLAKDQGQKMGQQSDSLSSQFSDVPAYENVRIQLNQPVNFWDAGQKSGSIWGRSLRLYQSSFNGPHDETGALNKWARAHQFQKTSDSAPLYASIFTVNYDPGRGLLYCGCFLICLGIGIMYYLKTGKSKSVCIAKKDALGLTEPSGQTAVPETTAILEPKRGSTAVLLFLTGWVWIMSGGNPVVAVEPGEKPDFQSAMETFRQLPVLANGRVQPLNTIAVTSVKTLCGTANPVISIEGLNLPTEINAESTARIAAHFTNGTERRFSAQELYWYWLIEPEVWEHIPFLECRNADLRKLLSAPLQGGRGQALRYVSPYQVADSQALSEYRYNMATRQQQEQRQGIEGQKTALEKAVEKLIRNFETYRSITFYPPAAENSREAVVSLASRILQSWMIDLSAPMNQKVQGKPELVTAVANIDRYGESLRKLFMSDPNSEESRKLDRSLSAFTHLLDLYQKEIARLIVFLEDVGTDGDKSAAELSGNSSADSSADTSALAISASTPTNAQLLRKLKQFQNELFQLRYKLYDESGQMGWVPSLNPESVDLWRNLDDTPAVWLNLPTLLYGDEIVLAGFKPDSIARFRRAWAEAALSSSGSNGFARSMEQVETELKNLAKEGENRKLLWESDRLDQAVIDHSKYPQDVRYARNELFYYDVNPFVKSWIWAAIAFALLVLERLSVVLAVWLSGRKPEEAAKSANVKTFSRGQRLKSALFWLGFAALSVSLLYNIVGLGLRGWIMSRSPIANMFETIAFVALCSGLIGIWFTIKPILGSRLQRAWALSGTSRLLQIPRILVAGALFYALVFVSYGAGNGYSAVELMPRHAVGAVFPTISDFLVWLSSIGLLIAVVWWIPRLVGTLLAIPLCADAASANARTAKASTLTAISQETDAFSQPKCAAISAAPLICAAAMVFILTLGACKAPMFNDDLKNLMPILRDNFWLAIHVLSIVGGYGCAALAWILGNAALGCFAIGRYQPSSNASIGCRLPVLCETLSESMYNCIKATIWLLAIGIILGGLWADVSWGRFWSWDRKEVWALISLFVYLIFVHACHWGWFKRNRALTLTLGSVSGALAILMAWYGVNYLLGSAMHGYASGSGGLAPAIAFFCANVAFASLAVIRYVNEN